MKLWWVLIALVLTGCSTTVPVKLEWPEPPLKSALQACPDLEKLADQVKISDVSKVINHNYLTYQECAIKMDAWIEWYETHKKLWNRLR